MTWKAQMTTSMNRVTAIKLLGSLVNVLILVRVLKFFWMPLNCEALSAHLLVIMILLILWLLWLFGIIIILLKWLYHLNILLTIRLDIRILLGYGLFRLDCLLRLDDLLLCISLLLNFLLYSCKIIFIICDFVFILLFLCYCQCVDVLNELLSRFFWNISAPYWLSPD